MLEVEIFRFEAGLDYASYYKPYLYEKWNFKNLKELLDDIKKGDPYFKFDGVEWVKLNHHLVNLEENLDEILALTGDIIKISPLYKKRSVKDLIIDDSDFLKAFDKFSEFKSEKEFYKSLKPLFYSNRVLKFKEDFIGNSAFVFAKHLIDKFPSKKDEILEIIKDEIHYYITPKFVFNDPFNTNECVNFLRKELNLSQIKESEKFISGFEKIKSDKFKGFKIAVYNDEELVNLVKNIGAEVVKFDLNDHYSGARIYEFDKDVALFLASGIVFNAYDEGSDFLVVNDKEAFLLFDGKAKEIEKFANRYLYNYYILSADELVKLANDEKPSFENHTLKVGLV
ncbi:hypothetical protein [Campylobacter corcagiensis]|uniref:DUF5644 domain-containing protein n=1 Tax=Campylobacter corcagiensis TaxID=1448857 RepID=A0A7M1LFG6_9BACT|nr:hypothetical protein [Campylobacter corcagiensis]QKF64490.1 hypothetical protein CCORG_0621 [Campylobacter corcagiensis]QOQ87329.1 hypothetical protein IMC76_00455 [Campylobacter corcagiensis]